MERLGVTQNRGEDERSRIGKQSVALVGMVGGIVGVEEGIDQLHF